MVKKVPSVTWPLLFALLFALLLAACSSSSESVVQEPAKVEVSAEDRAAAVSIVTEVAEDVTSEAGALVTEAAADDGAKAAAEAPVDIAAVEKSAEDYDFDSAGTAQINLADDSITVEGEGVQVDGAVATITAAGTYNISGQLTEGQIVVDTEDDDVVRIILNGVDITNSTTAPIFVANASETVIMLADNSQNMVTDGGMYVFEDPEKDEPNAAVFSKADLTILGNGSLTVEANYNDGISSKEGLIIAGGGITVNAIDDGIRGKDYLVIQDGTLNVTAQGDGLKSEADEYTSLGYIAIDNGEINISSGGDAMQAESVVTIAGGEFAITSGGGSNVTITDDTSAKGIKAGVGVIIDGGTFSINSADDAVHSNDSMVINGGSFLVATGGDGFHADAALEFNGGAVQITESYEGIESAMIAISDGEFNIVSSDDGINVAGGNDSSGLAGPGGGQGTRPGGGGPPPEGYNGGPGQDTFAEYSGDYYLYINGGYIVADASGDGVDVNGSIEMTDGVLIVNGPTEQMNGALDHDGPFTISGGFFVAGGSVGMAQTATAASTQNALLLNLNGTLPGGTIIHIEDSSGNNLLTFAPSKAYQSIAFSSPDFVSGMTYTVYYGGTDSGTFADGLYVGGEYSGGTKYGTFTASEGITSIGSTGRS